MFFARKAKVTLTAYGLIVAGAMTPVAVAANEAGSGNPPLIPVQATTFDQETIDAFAAARTRVDEIRSTYLPQFQQAQTEAEQQKINQQATQEMAEAVEATPNITIEEYDAVVRAVREDPNLSDRIDEAMAEPDI
ncbi:DUF4168 domain-containing protein [Roseivivax sediminis]|uniref:DUF4168 domain-containing protein n=1 Tax=Roseivivax sediminis TaxID=936889 RepID=A0A1I2CQ87_9RHOB|nr:DUF4168 domain-containing protein [Roseivivax sediminis]SFE70394.1 protein of unknown function [Roseivivax sediminis]